MDDRLSKMEARLRDQDAALAAILQRLARLEARDRAQALSPGDTGSSATDQTSELSPEVRPGAEPRGLVSLSLIGRTCVVLGGAYLLRALTDSRTIPDSGGVALGFAYAATWFVAADHAGARRPASGVFHGLAAVAIGLALLWEASTRFQILGPGGSAIALGLVSTLGLGVAWHRQLQGLALATATGTVATAIALAIASREPMPYAVLMLMMGLAAWRMADTCGWALLPWAPAAASVMLNTLLIARAAADPALEPPVLVIAVLGLYAVGHVAAFGTWMWDGTRRLDVFVALQTLAVVLLGIGGSVFVSIRAGGAIREVVGLALLALAATAYLASLRAMRGLSEWDGAGWYLSTVAMASTIAGIAAFVPGSIQPWVWLGSTLVCVAGARWRNLPVLALHGAGYAIAAAATSGVLAFAAIAWTMPARHWTDPPIVTWPLIALAIGLLAVRASSTPARVVMATLLTVVLGSVVVWSLAWLAPALASTSARVATLRTVVLAAAAMASGAAARWRFGRELGWLAYPAIVIGGAKLLFEDLGASPPAALFIALAAYGVALIVTSRLKAGTADLKVGATDD